jgi:hypothetical protein
MAFFISDLFLALGSDMSAREPVCSMTDVESDMAKNML